MSALDIYAGPRALKILKENGLSSDLFTSFLAASGGPKCFSLFSLDKYIFGEYFKGRSEPLSLVGSSIGAYRCACLAQKNPIIAIDRLAESYIRTVYSKNADAREITQNTKELIKVVYPDKDVSHALNNPIFKIHFIVARAKGWAASENKWLQGAALSKSYVLNYLARDKLTKQYDRIVFKCGGSDFAFSDPYGFYTEFFSLTEENFSSALLASGAIPIVMEGVDDIVGAPAGMYRDGGMVDYHFDIKIKNPGLTLYPHFNSQPKAGWFDKSLSRSVLLESYDNVVIISPSRNFIESLPYKKIPDRSDFKCLSDKDRMNYWRKVLQETKRLVDEFDSIVVKQDISKVKLFKP